MKKLLIEMCDEDAELYASVAKSLGVSTEQLARAALAQGCDGLRALVGIALVERACVEGSDDVN